MVSDHERTHSVTRQGWVNRCGGKFRTGDDGCRLDPQHASPRPTRSGQRQLVRRSTHLPVRSRSAVGRRHGSAARLGRDDASGSTSAAGTRSGDLGQPHPAALHRASAATRRQTGEVPCRLARRPTARRSVRPGGTRCGRCRARSPSGRSTPDDRPWGRATAIVRRWVALVDDRGHRLQGAVPASGRHRHRPSPSLTVTSSPRRTRSTRRRWARRRGERLGGRDR